MTEDREEALNSLVTRLIEELEGLDVEDAMAAFEESRDVEMKYVRQTPAGWVKRGTVERGRIADADVEIDFSIKTGSERSDSMEVPK